MNNINKVNNFNYNSELVLTYKMFKDDNDSNLCYQIQLLQAFNMLKYDDFILQKNIESVYELLKNNNEIKNILLIISEKMKAYESINSIHNNVKNYVIFQLLFSYNYFETFHKCFSDYINEFKKNNILNKKDNYFEKLKTFVNNNDL